MRPSGKASALCFAISKDRESTTITDIALMRQALA